LSIPETFSVGGQRIIPARDEHCPTGTTAPGADLLDEYLRLTVAGDWNAFQALHAMLSAFVRDSAACLYGHNGMADVITEAVFSDVWELAYTYRPGREGVRAWVLNVAGQHTMSRYLSSASDRASEEGTPGRT
jgi:RNA polymerase sigma-70 factor (ECF subfamily)